MTHEFKKIIETYALLQKSHQKAVLATVVCVEGSSYRREGVRMLVLENNATVGAISGGCVEKEVIRQAQSVLTTGISKMMTYDGRFRLGCEGTLYVLLEEMSFDKEQLIKIQDVLKARDSFQIGSYFSKESESSIMGSRLVLPSGTSIYMKKGIELDFSLDNFEEELRPCFQLVIFGAEHDSVKLCEIANATGWEVTVVCSSRDPKAKNDFPGVSEIIISEPENFKLASIDSETAVVLMSHNFAKDMLFLKALKNYNPIYVGLLGPAKRREQLLGAYIEYHPEVEESFLDRIHGPAGLNIGAETPNEIAISIVSEILSIIRNEKVIPLQDKIGAIHPKKNIGKVSTE
jgi:xanthine/CO dehydrogenase XdhC/CoxF family maturation factor